MFTRRQGEALQALQQIVGSAFRGDRTDERRLVVDCNGYRRDKDAELHQMAAFLAEKAKSTGLAQEMGPLNPYERRIVHMAVAGGRVGDLREHRRRVREDGHHLGEVAAAPRAALREERRVLHRRHDRGRGDAGRPRRHGWRG